MVGAFVRALEGGSVVGDLFVHRLAVRWELQASPTVGAISAWHWVIFVCTSRCGEHVDNNW